MGGSCQACERFWAIHRNGVSKNQPVESTWSLRGPRGSKTLAQVLQRGLVESGDSLIPRQNIVEHFLTLLLYFLAFTLCFYIPRIAMLE